MNVASDPFVLPTSLLPDPRSTLADCIARETSGTVEPSLLQVIMACHLILGEVWQARHVWRRYRNEDSDIRQAIQPYWKIAVARIQGNEAQALHELTQSDLSNTLPYAHELAYGIRQRCLQSWVAAQTPPPLYYAKVLQMTPQELTQLYQQLVKDTHHVSGTFTPNMVPSSHVAFLHTISR